MEIQVDMIYLLIVGTINILEYNVKQLLKMKTVVILYILQINKLLQQKKILNIIIKSK